MGRNCVRGGGTSRRAFLTKAAALGAGAAVAPVARAFAESDAENYVMLLVCDALRADRLGCYGHTRTVDGVTRSLTPVIDSIAARGVLYERCIAQANWTQSSMASLFHSAWPVIKGDKHTFDYVPEGSRALIEATGGAPRIGVYSNPYLTSPIYSDQFDEYRFIKTRDYCPGQRTNDEFDWVAAAAVRKRKSLFGYIHYMDTHEPYDMKQRFRGKLAKPGWKYAHPLWLNEQLAPYRDDTGKVTGAEAPEEITSRMYGMADGYDEDLMYLDLSIGELFRYLKLYKIEDKVTLIIASDHGQSFGEHGWAGHKATLYQPEIDVPLIIAGPGLPKGKRVKAQVRNVDIVPTIAALCGVSARGYVGAPLLPVERVEAGGNRIAYSTCDHVIYGPVRRLLTTLITPERKKYMRVLTDHGHKLLREELYDLEADPHETKDLAATEAGLLAETSRRMDDFERAAFWREVSGGSPEVDEDARQQLEALGYIAR